jgi:peptide/nickel transport system permease protein
MSATSLDLGSGATELSEALSRSASRRRRPWNLYVGAGLVILLVLTALVSFVWTPQDPNAVDVEARLQGVGTPGHILGTDQFGRDVLSQLMAGSRNSLYVGIVGTAVALLVGTALGGIAAVRRGWLEGLIIRASDVVLAFPGILVAVVLSAKLGPGNEAAVIAIAIWFTPIVARVTRASANQVFEYSFVLAARAYGRSRAFVMVRHVLPNIASVLIVQATVMFALAILVEAALAFLGLGAQAPASSWGRMINDAQGFVATQPLLAVWPGLAIMLSVLGFNLLGDGLRDALDPKLRRRTFQ